MREYRLFVYEDHDGLVKTCLIDAEDMACEDTPPADYLPPFASEIRELGTVTVDGPAFALDNLGVSYTED